MGLGNAPLPSYSSGPAYTPLPLSTRFSHRPGRWLSKEYQTSDSNSFKATNRWYNYSGQTHTANSRSGRNLSASFYPQNTTAFCLAITRVYRKTQASGNYKDGQTLVPHSVFSQLLASGQIIQPQTSASRIGRALRIGPRVIIFQSTATTGDSVLQTHGAITIL